MSMQAVIASARSFIGRKEASDGSVSGITDWLDGAQENFGEDYPWCAAAVSRWMFDGGERDLTRKEIPEAQFSNGFASTDFMAAAFEDRGLIFEKPRVGDLVFYDFDDGTSNKKASFDTSHVGLVVAVNPDGSFQAIEGNTGDDEVLERKRQVNDTVGFGRPTYGAAPPPPASEPAPPPPAGGAKPYPGDVLERGDRGEGVRAVQARLNELGVGLDPDGAYGPLTEAAVVRFQRAKELAPDGAVGPNTWAFLFDTDGAVQPYPGDVLEDGDRGPGVRAVQDRLNQLNERLDPDGAYGPLTDAAVVRFQRANNLAPDGDVGPQTWAFLFDTDGAVQPYPGDVLDEGDRGAGVRAVQARLNEVGVGLKTDGVYGPLTEAAVERFQRAEGLVADGDVGPQTWAALWDQPAPAEPPAQPPPPKGSPPPPPGGLNAILAEMNPTGMASGGVAASRKAAQEDLARVDAFAGRFQAAGEEFDLPPALIAAVASRESRVGNALDRDGTGDSGFGNGIMQVDERYHDVVRIGADFASQGHINQATGILLNFVEAAGEEFPAWSAAVRLQAGTAAYNSGTDVFDDGPGNFDRGTTGNDYSNDVIARARFYAANWTALIA